MMIALTAYGLFPQLNRFLRAGMETGQTLRAMMLPDRPGFSQADILYRAYLRTKAALVA